VRPRIQTSATHGVPVYSPAFAGTHSVDTQRDGHIQWTWVPGSAPRWSTHPMTATNCGH